MLLQVEQDQTEATLPMLISVEETIPVRAIVRRAMVSAPIQTTVRRAIRAVLPNRINRANLYAAANLVNLANSVNPVILETLVSLPSPIRHQVGIVSSADKSISKLSLIESS